MFRSLTLCVLCLVTAFALGVAVTNALYAIFSPVVHMPVF